MKPEQILTTAAKNIALRAQIRDRGSERSMLRTVRTFNALTGHSLDEHDGWVFMAILKFARAYGGAFHADDYIDAASYAALAGECAAHASVEHDALLEDLRSQSEERTQSAVPRDPAIQSDANWRPN